jgi:hypothetical protein
MAMDGMDTTMQVAAGAHGQVSGAVAGTVAGIFLHAGWRSCGTWMWERLRENPGVRGFYEPLHEDLATLKQRDIGLLRPDSWKSGHSAGAPYFTEFAPMLGQRGGVHGHGARFAFDRFFAGAETDDRQLELYLRGLMASAAAEGRLPVMKFCRSLGRVSWMETHFPDVLHAVIVRDPQAQWRSARRQMEQNNNRYFVLAPFVILARNADHPLLADAVARLGVKMPPILSRNLGITTDACWRHVQKLDWRDRFRGFLALWVASGIASLGGQAAIDADRLMGDPAHRDAAERTLSAASGIKIGLMPDYPQDSAAIGSDAEQQDAAAAKHAALGVLQSHGHALGPERKNLLAHKLGSAYTAAEPGGQQVQAPKLLDYIDAAAYVAFARASYPLRRTHYYVRRWLAAG